MYRKQKKQESLEIPQFRETNSFSVIESYNRLGLLNLGANTQKNTAPAYKVLQNDTENLVIQINKIGFFFDYRRFLFENSNFPSIFNSTPEISELGLGNSRIANIKITRLRVDHKTLLDNKEEEVVSEELHAGEYKNDHFKIYTKRMSSLPDLLFITCSDPGLFYKTYGIFKYKIYISVIDGSMLTVQQLYNSTIQYIKNIEEALKIASRPIIVENIIKDLNPHIDQNDEFNNLKINNGFYNTVEDVFDKTLSQIEGFSSSQLNQYLDHYIKLRKFFLFANNKEINKDETEKELKDLREYLKIVISPGTGNPDGVLLFIDLLKQACELLISLDSGFTQGVDPQLPKSSTIIQHEHTFSLHVNSEIEKNVGFEYFRNIKEVPGLNSIPSSLFSMDMNGYQRLQNIVFPLNRQIARLDVANNFGLTEKEDIVLAYVGLDIALSLYGHPEFHSIAVSGLASRYVSNQDDDTIKKDLIYKTLASSNILSNNNITIELPELNKNKTTTQAQSSSGLAVSPNADAINLFKILLSRELTVGILNTAKRHKNESLSSYYNRFIKYTTKSFLYPFIDMTNIGKDIEESSILKIKYETSAKIYSIGFERDGFGYNLRKMRYTDIKNTNLDQEHLCTLMRYTDDTLDLNLPTFGKVPIFNEFFISTSEVKDGMMP